MRYLTKHEIIKIHAALMATSGGGGVGIRDINGLESATYQPQMTFGDIDLYPTIGDKAAILCFVLVSNHPFIDGNKRIGHAAMEMFLLLNGYELIANTNEQEQIILNLAAGKLSKE
ncbi:MAG: type II toxin-antitoxin system death-on-curing family toxin, partial [Chitinophagales bacterium]|nr:type II toxin-antitoxin system death-on-curing family toxin [Chitinophagales bacterium]